jgi:hypothetical protein
VRPNRVLAQACGIQHFLVISAAQYGENGTPPLTMALIPQHFFEPLAVVIPDGPKHQT